MRRNARERIGDESAQGLIEFALIAMILMFLMLGTIDFSRFMYYDTAIHSAARVGAEVAGNHCTPYCGALTVTTDDFVVQRTVCEADINLQPQPAQGCGGCQPISTAPGGCNDPYNTSAGSYSAVAPSLAKDVNVTPAYLPDGGDGLPSTPTAVTVSVGYNFTPISPLMGQFFPAISCYSGDSISTNHHTICAIAVTKVSS